MIRGMAGKKIEMSATGRTVAKNITRYRKSKGMTYTELSKRLAAAGRDVSPLAVRRIEEQGRRVDVDDLIAIAAALGERPNTLLFPDVDESSSQCEVTGVGALDASLLWDWLQGLDILPSAGKEEQRFQRRNIQFDLSSIPPWELREMFGQMRGTYEKARALREQEGAGLRGDD